MPAGRLRCPATSTRVKVARGVVANYCQRQSLRLSRKIGQWFERAVKVKESWRPARPRLGGCARLSPVWWQGDEAVLR